MSAFLIVLIVFLTLLPGLAWLFFFLHEDIHPEPKRLIFYTFCFGVLASIPVFLFQFFGEKFISESFSGTLAIPIISLFFLAFVEEVFKFFAAYWAVGKSPELDEPIDAMIYMIVAALGLATIENFFVITGIVKIGGIDMFSNLVNVIVLRFVSATLLHALSSGLLGYYWAKGRLRKKTGKYILLGILIATLVHFIFNYLVLSFQNVDLLLYPSMFLVFAAFFTLKDFQKLRNKS
jgi:protease PrsW